MSDAVESVQVFILAENRLLREALTRILGKKNDIVVVGASAFSPDVVEQISSVAPDVLLSDSAAVGVIIGCLRLVSEVRAAIPGLKVVMIGMDAGPRDFSARCARRNCRFRAQGCVRDGSGGCGPFRSQR